MIKQMVRLGAVTQMFSGFAFKSENFIGADDDGIKLVRGDNVQQGYIRWGDKTKKWANEEYDALARYQLLENDVILAMDRPVVGGGLKLARIKEQDLPCLLVQRVTCLRGKEDVALTEFIRYVLAGPNFLAHVEKITTGANIPHISGKDIAAFEFDLPPIALQQGIIAGILAYDDLIETNRRRIALLEESARLLYREWFVNLKFPNSQCTPISNGVPVDWNWRRLCDIGKQQREQVVPRDLTSATAYLSMEHMTPRSICLGEWGNADCITSAKLRFQPNDILFGRIRPYFHKIGFAQIVGVTSTDMIVVRANDEDLFPLILLAMATDEFIAHAVATSNGSKMPRADWKVLKNWVLLLPPSKLRKQFASILHPMLAMITELTKTNLQLAQARNELLPKLMSGELRL